MTCTGGTCSARQGNTGNFRKRLREALHRIKKRKLAEVAERPYFRPSHRNMQCPFVFRLQTWNQPPMKWGLRG